MTFNNFRFDHSDKEMAAFNGWVWSQPEQWYVYIFAASDGEHVKIGRTMHLGQRQDQLRRPKASKSPLFLFDDALPNGRFVYFETDGYRKERNWQQVFKEYRVGGEWFLLCPDDDNAYGIPPCGENEVACLDIFIQSQHRAVAEASDNWNPFDPAEHLSAGWSASKSKREQEAREGERFRKALDGLFPARSSA